MARTWFMWRRTDVGAQPQIVYEHMPEEHLRRALVVKELTDEEKQAVKDRLHQEMQKFGSNASLLSVMMEMFPCPAIE